MSKVIDTGSANGQGTLVNWDNVLYVRGGFDSGVVIHFVGQEEPIDFPELTIEMVADGAFREA